MALLRHDTSQAVELTGMPLQVVLRLLDALESPEDGPLVLREVNVEFLRRLLFHHSSYPTSSPIGGLPVGAQVPKSAWRVCAGVLSASE